MAKYYGAAAEYNKPTGFRFDRRLVTIIVLVFVAIIFVSLGLILLRSFSDAPKTEMTTLVVRQQRLQQFVANQQPSIKNGDLAKVNSDANLLFISDNVALRKQFATAFGKLEITDDISRAESDTTSTKELKSATLINRFDTTYVTILRDKIAATKALAQTQANKNDGTLKTTLQTIITNLGNIDGQLAQLNL